MIEIDDCIHGLGPKGHCTICNGKDEAARRQAAKEAIIISVFPARYAGTMRCGHDVEIGETIGKRADHGYVCGECVNA